MTSFTLSRRALIGSAGAVFLAACSKGVGKSDTLFVGDQRGGSKVVLDAAGKLNNLPYRIEWSSFPNAAPLLEALNAGAIDSGIGGDAAFVFAIGTGASIKAIGAQKIDGPAAALVVQSGSSIRSIKDIAGKHIATPRGSAGHNYILAQLDAQGLPFDAVKFAFLTPQDGQAALQGGSVDGWAIWDPYSALAEQHGARVFYDEGLVHGYGLLFARDGAIAEKRPLLKDYHDRLYQGWNWSATHPDAYAALLNKETGVPTEIWQTINKRTIRGGTGIDEALLVNQQRTADRYLRAGLLFKPVDVSKGFDKTFS